MFNLKLTDRDRQCYLVGAPDNPFPVLLYITDPGVAPNLPVHAPVKVNNH